MAATLHVLDAVRVGLDIRHVEIGEKYIWRSKTGIIRANRGSSAKIAQFS